MGWTDWISYSDIQNRLEDSLWKQIFDKDRDGTVTTGSAGSDKTFLDTCLSAAHSTTAMELAEAYPNGLRPSDEVVDEAIKSCMVSIALYEGVKFSPLATSEAGSPFRTGYTDAMTLLGRIRKAQGVRPITAASGAPPQDRTDTVQNLTVEDSVSEETTLPYTQAADRRDWSDF